MFWVPEFLAPINLQRDAVQRLPKVGGIQVGNVGLNMQFAANKAVGEVRVYADLWYSGRLEGVGKYPQPVLFRAGKIMTALWANVPASLCDAVTIQEWRIGIHPHYILADVRRSDKTFDAWVESLENGTFWV